MINYGIQNQHIQEVIEKRGVFSKNMITYYPIGFDKDIYYTNEVLRKVLGDPCYSWANPFCTSRNSFDQPQYYRKQTFPFMLIGKKSDKINRWQYSGISGNPAQNSLSNTALSKKQGGFWCNGGSSLDNARRALSTDEPTKSIDDRRSSTDFTPSPIIFLQISRVTK